MRAVRLIGYRDEPTGELGLIIKGSEGPEIFSDREGGLIAHDVVEHQNGFAAIGCPADELEALGGLWHSRGRHGDLHHEYWRDPIETVGTGDIPQIARDWQNAENQRWYPRLGRYRTKRHLHDDEFEAILAHAPKNILAECYDEEEREKFPMEAFLDNALHLMRMGFNKAQRRFGRGWASNETYLAIREAVKPFAKSPDEGAEYVLCYGNGEARCRQIEVREGW